MSFRDGQCLERAAPETPPCRRPGGGDAGVGPGVGSPLRAGQRRAGGTADAAVALSGGAVFQLPLCLLLPLRPRHPDTGEGRAEPPGPGSILHFLFRRALETEGFTALPPEEVHKLTIRILAEYLDTALGGGEEKSGKFLYYFHRLQEAAEEILLALQRELGQSAFRVAAAEEPIAPGGEVQPLTVRDPSFTVQVGGKIDRVDEASVDGEQFVRVIDYKTGGKAFKLSEAKEGLNMQMLLYLFAVGESRGRFSGTVPAGILYMPAGPRQLKFGRDEGDALARAGLFKDERAGSR